MEPTLFWTIFGAIGSSLGALIGALALIIALKAYFQPITIALSARLTSGCIIAENIAINIYSISVSNKGLREVSISSITLQVGRKNLYVDFITQGTLLAQLLPRYPVRLSQGTSVSLHLPYEKFNSEMKRNVESSQINPKDRISIAVRDETDATHLFRTKFRVKDFCK